MVLTDSAIIKVLSDSKIPLGIYAILSCLHGNGVATDYDELERQLKQMEKLGRIELVWDYYRIPESTDTRKGGEKS